MSGAKGRSGGWNRKTTNEKIKLGVNKKSRLKLDAPERVAGEMILFEDLGENGKKLRDTFLPMLYNNGTIGVTDSIALHKFCRIAEDWFKVDKICSEKGRFGVSRDEAGKMVQVQFMWHKVECDLRAALDVCIRDLGLSPAARDGITKIISGKKLNQWAIK